jgi:lipopolysaccharide/colanic/teichoic acid biosynthesis glycosyltransferase
MKETLDRLALAEARRRAHSEAGQSQNRRTLLLAAGALLFCFGIMPFAYTLLTGGSILMDLEGDRAAHIWPNCGANALVVLGALLVTGRLDRKLTAVLTLVLIVHGALAFLILTTRSPYSNQIMLTAVPASAVLGAALMYMKHRLTPLRIALVGPDVASIGQVRVAYDRIRDPAFDLRSYDVLLTTSVIDLSPEWAKVLSRSMIAGKPVRHVVEHMEEEQGIVSIDHFELDHLPAMGLTSYRTRKRLMDIGLALAVLPLALPILIAGAMAVLVSMGRPVFFVQPRTGQGGKVFKIYKLRTMQAAVENQGAATVKGDPRITAVGAVLRRFRVDELPQLLNVLKGDMSIIGPRPEWTLLSEKYSRDLPAYVYRHLVRPGITGWAQVRGGYASDLAETRTKVGYDLYYIKNLSFSFDLQILIRTLWTLLAGGGAR